tara:strand:+ start:190 stop:621 length:432 start_codon:yes stop_codon:yes gene_type:complete
MYDAGYFKMPDPVGLQEDSVWLEIPRISRTIPFGYEVYEEDQDVLIPIVEELEALELAKDYLTEYSYRDVARWLSDRTGRQISHIGLRKRVQKEKQRKSKAATYRAWAKKYETAIKKFKELEEKRTGAKEKTGEREEEKQSAA